MMNHNSIISYRQSVLIDSHRTLAYFNRPMPLNDYLFSLGLTIAFNNCHYGHDLYGVCCLVLENLYSYKLA